ncbi:MAG: T9SS type A sorting domain-containing protein [Bacteroidetes bacterium]|nr:T9SS type A sorting domain-containing protein [Bacteroidota bacterium]
MKKTIYILTLFLISIIQNPLFAQEYAFEDIIGTWHGYISSETFGGYNDPMTMTIFENGFYTETSGHLMPTIYPNTQQCEYDAETNRMHWWYLQLVYAGQYFYQHFYYDVVYFNNDTLEMHYNYWDDPEPHPQVGTIFLVRENLIPPPLNLTVEIIENNMMLNWNAPDVPPGSELLGYNIYYKFDDEMFDMIDFIEETSYTHSGDFQPGIHSYYLTALYDLGESDPSVEVEVEVLITSIADLIEKKINVYPNPASEIINIHSDIDVNSILIYNSTGQAVRKLGGGAITQSISVNELPEGLYFIMVNTSKGSVTKKIQIR